MCRRPVGRIPEKTRSRIRVAALPVSATAVKRTTSIASPTDAPWMARGCLTGRVELEQAIRSRRTVKAFGREPVERETLEELLELARWAPNHNLTNPWRFRVLGQN